MSHTIASLKHGTMVAAFQLTVVNYTAVTGETFTLPELMLGPNVSIIPVLNPSSRNSLGSLIFPVFAAGVLKLFRFVSGAPVEVPTTSALNAIFDVALIVEGQ